MDNPPVGVDHYENFPVASRLCPARLRPAVAAIYRFARTADDLADEGDAPAERRLADLRAYRDDLMSMQAGEATSSRWRHIFGPLQQAKTTHALPITPFEDLLSAFEQDVVKHAYRDRSELLDYCRRSANPVGRLMLRLYDVEHGEALQLSDAICTGLQLANFWQDLSVDTARGRLYVPALDCARHGVDPADLLSRRAGPGMADLLADLVGWTRALMLRGAPLTRNIPGSAGWELRLVVQGGQRILDKVERAGASVLESRPRLRGYEAPLLLWRTLWMKGPASAAARKAA
jgi:squalene synthase HpnC